VSAQVKSDARTRREADVHVSGQRTRRGSSSSWFTRRFVRSDVIDSR
jgi:hypothetical protein